ncbi:DNA repair protein RecO [Entomobacter blattae]|uniref:DNA repair protein RecO n=1 Tax=Entomobacter blattae TaxID=2762277 RepID=A0A7H1NS42_9PROT|nr:DNA repair protein RecO [Entomobacter blattae]QNT78602.1 DNA repair protein RecO [Entomobacter blattae]
MEWKAPALILSAFPYGENSLVAKVLTREHGVSSGLVKGGASRRQSALWQPGNIAMLRWYAKLPGQLGSFQGELQEALAARVMVSGFHLSLLTASCALVSQAWPEYDPMPVVFDRTLELVEKIATSAQKGEQGEVQRYFLLWGKLLLDQLGYGLDLETCALTGENTGLKWVSPRTGRAVTDEAAQPWKKHLLPLPQCLVKPSAPFLPEDWLKGLQLLGYFFQKNIFSPCNKPLPAAYVRLYEQAK